jgi:hypothetical protein
MLHIALSQVALAIFLAAGNAWEETDESEKGSVNVLSMEVNALQTLHQFQFTPSQLKTLRKIALPLRPELGERQRAKTSDEFRQTLLELRAALVDGDDDRIDELQEKLDALRDAESPEVDDDVEITDKAKPKVKEVLRMLSPRQVAAHIAAYGDEVPEPLESLLAAIDKVRGLNEKDWKELREKVSEEVGRLAAGLDTDKSANVTDQVVQLLIHVRALKDDEFKKERPEFERTARRIVGDLGPFDVLHRLVERSLAELLSNPRLLSAIDALSEPQK